MPPCVRTLRTKPCRRLEIYPGRHLAICTSLSQRQSGKAAAGFSATAAPTAAKLWSCQAAPSSTPSSSAAVLIPQAAQPLHRIRKSRLLRYIAQCLAVFQPIGLGGFGVAQHRPQSTENVAVTVLNWPLIFPVISSIFSAVSCAADSNANFTVCGVTVIVAACCCL